jgi:hypothetical protein
MASPVEYCGVHPQSGKEKEAGRVALLIVELTSRRDSLQVQRKRAEGQMEACKNADNVRIELAQRCYNIMRGAQSCYPQGPSDWLTCFSSLNKLFDDMVRAKDLENLSSSALTERLKDIDVELEDVDRKTRLAHEELDAFVVKDDKDCD